LAIARQAKERRARNVELLAGYSEATANTGLRDGVFPALGRTLPLRLAQPAQESEFHEIAIAMRMRSAKLPSVGLLTCGMACCPVAG
jgi:hypothetical protein